MDKMPKVFGFFKIFNNISFFIRGIALALCSCIFTALGLNYVALMYEEETVTTENSIDIMQSMEEGMLYKTVITYVMFFILAAFIMIFVGIVLSFLSIGKNGKIRTTYTVISNITNGVFSCLTCFFIITYAKVLPLCLTIGVSALAVAGFLQIYGITYMGQYLKGKIKKYGNAEKQ